MAANSNSAEWRGGYYYDWFERRWIERPAEAMQRLPRRGVPRRTLLAALVEEVEKGDSDAKLYAALLARSLIGCNMELMHEFGERIAKLSKEDVKRSAD